MNEVGGNNLIGGVKEDALEIGLGGLFHGLANFLVGSVFGGADGEIDDADGGRGNAEGHAREFALDFRANEADRFGGTGGGGDDVNRGGSSAFPILTGWTIDRFLGGGVAVDGGHEPFFHSKTLLKENVHEWGEAVGRAGSVGDNVMFCVVVLEMIDAHDNGYVLTFGRGGNNDLGAARGEMALSFICFSEEACRFNDVVDAKIFPRQGGRTFFDGKALDFMTIDDENIVFGSGRGGFLAMNFSRESALGGVVLHEVSEVICGDEIIDGDHIKLLPEKALLAEGTENKAADSSETIDCNFFISHKSQST